MTGSVMLPTIHNRSVSTYRHCRRPRASDQTSVCANGFSVSHPHLCSGCSKLRHVGLSLSKVHVCIDWFSRFVSCRLTNREYSIGSNGCIQFWCYINGSAGNTGKLPAVQQNVITRSLVNVWCYGQIPVSRGLNISTVIFDASKTTWDVIIGVEDMEINIGTCPPPINYNFEGRYLWSWTQMKDDEFHSLLQQGVSDTHGTEPSAGEYEPLDRTKNTIEHTACDCRPHIAVRLFTLCADKRVCSDVNSISWTESRHKRHGHSSIDVWWVGEFCEMWSDSNSVLLMVSWTRTTKITDANSNFILSRLFVLLGDIGINDLSWTPNAIYLESLITGTPGWPVTTTTSYRKCISCDMTDRSKRLFFYYSNHSP